MNDDWCVENLFNPYGVVVFDACAYTVIEPFQGSLTTYSK